ncbi:nnp-1 protein putative nuclear protein 1 nop52 [Anaeramoeba ignava]|uniref:Nnp-1 protein putative nuclear protein 1 nop52 n=1 Tax=Anaeramoeba ignava TaxID=1746090 RepID=A0A9Q0LCE8_ANAIG|nr:nnp-1 protein putative nuclear protein 1 nop52 [Anaeramoeba ignava]
MANNNNNNNLNLKEINKINSFDSLLKNLNQNSNEKLIEIIFDYLKTNLIDWIQSLLIIKSLQNLKEKEIFLKYLINEKIIPLKKQKKLLKYLSEELSKNFISEIDLQEKQELKEKEKENLQKQNLQKENQVGNKSRLIQKESFNFSKQNNKNQNQNQNENQNENKFQKKKQKRYYLFQYFYPELISDNFFEPCDELSNYFKKNNETEIQSNFNQSQQLLDLISQKIFLIKEKHSTFLNCNSNQQREVYNSFCTLIDEIMTESRKLSTKLDDLEETLKLGLKEESKEIDDKISRFFEIVSRFNSLINEMKSTRDTFKEMIQEKLFKEILKVEPSFSKRELQHIVMHFDGSINDLVILYQKTHSKKQK